MNARTTTRPQAPPSPSTPPRPVSDNPIDPRTCGDHAITRPRYFAGQVLSDRSLTRLIDWTRDRLGLVRYRHGWGVVCGLDVWSTCENRGTLTVGPGYAVTCCGDDVFLADPLTFDLTRVSQSQNVKTEPGGAICVIVEESEGSNSETKTDSFFGVPASELHGFDLYLRALDIPGDPQPAPQRGSCCSDATPCAYTTVCEDVELVALPVPDPPATAQTLYSAWYDRFEAWSKDINALLDRFEGGTETELSPNAVQVLMQRVAKKARHFPILCDWLTQSKPSADQLPKPSKEQLLKILFWLVIDERATLLAQLSGDCPKCNDVPGVPLARVWVRVQAMAGKPPCHVLAVSTGLPYRRPIHLDDRWPAEAGKVNLGRLLGARWDEKTKGDDFRHELAALGVTPDTVADPYNLNSLQAVRNLTAVAPSGIIQTRGDTVRALLFPDRDSEPKMVVGLRKV